MLFRSLQAIYRHDQRGVFLLLDFAPYLKYAGTQRQVRDILQRRNCLPHVLVLIDGLLAAAGTPQEVALDATVRSRYLGRGFQAGDVHV